MNLLISYKFIYSLPEITRGLFTFAIFISYALQCYVPISIIWENYVPEKIRESEKCELYLLFLRAVTTIFTFLVAAAVPELGLFISLFGAFCLSILGLAFPAIMVCEKNIDLWKLPSRSFFQEICVLYPDKFGNFKMHLWKDIGLIIFAFIGLTSGTYASMKDIIASFSKES